MNEDNVELEAIVQNGMETNKKLDGIDTINEAQYMEQRDTKEAVRDVETSIDAQTLAVDKGLKGMSPSLETMARAQDLIATFITKLEGPKGDAGYTPKKGKDYFTKEEIDKFLKEVTPKKGEDYYTEQEIEAFKEAITPKKGTDYNDGKDGYTPIKGKDYFDGRDGVDGKDARVFYHVGKTAPKNAQIGDLWLKTD